jgi:hypothetical protein
MWNKIKLWSDTAEYDEVMGASILTVIALFVLFCLGLWIHDSGWEAVKLIGFISVLMGVTVTGFYFITLIWSVILGRVAYNKRKKYEAERLAHWAEHQNQAFGAPNSYNNGTDYP